MRKKIMCYIISGYLIILPILGAKNVSANARISIQSWNLVDSGKHMDWEGSSKYLTEFKSAVKIWENHISGIIRKKTEQTRLDLTISDYNSLDGVSGITYSNGNMRFNTAYYVFYSKEQRINVCLHELGHALGLDHNQKGDVMYKDTTYQTQLSSNDKLSHSYLFNCIY